jgi:protein-tyrosine-phosphatase
VSPEAASAAGFGPAKRNVFLMIRFRDSPDHDAITETIRRTLDDYGLTLLRADWNVHHAQLFENVRLNMDASEYGVAVFEQIGGEPISPNVALELGYMLAKEKRCLLLRDTRAPMLPADLAGHLCREFDGEHVEETVSDAVRAWLSEIGLAKRPDERLLVYVSHGGTCRDPMAKAITEKLLAERAAGRGVRVEARGLSVNEAEASIGAREAIRRVYGDDLLQSHVPRQLTPRIEQEADLILVMSERMLNPKSPAAVKTAAFKAFFGMHGDIEDPWRADGNADAEAIAR